MINCLCSSLSVGTVFIKTKVHTCLIWSLDKTKAENEDLKKYVKTYEKKIRFTRNVTEQKFLENISNPDFYRDDPHLVQVYTATLNEDEFRGDFEDQLETKEEFSPSRSRRDIFLAGVEKNLNKDHQEPSYWKS